VYSTNIINLGIKLEGKKNCSIYTYKSYNFKAILQQQEKYIQSSLLPFWRSCMYNTLICFSYQWSRGISKDHKLGPSEKGKNRRKKTAN